MTDFDIVFASDDLGEFNLYLENDIFGNDISDLVNDFTELCADENY